LIPNEAVANYAKVKNDLDRKYGYIPLLDLTGMSLGDECFGDADHVNAVGAKVVSLEVQKQIDQFVNQAH
jgi:hypothetical protein